MSRRLTRLRNGSVRVGNGRELHISAGELLPWGIVLQECIAALEDVIDAQRIVFKMTEEEQNDWELPCDFLETPERETRTRTTQPWSSVAARVATEWLATPSQSREQSALAARFTCTTCLAGTVVEQTLATVVLPTTAVALLPTSHIPGWPPIPVYALTRLSLTAASPCPRAHLAGYEPGFSSWHGVP